MIHMIRVTTITLEPDFGTVRTAMYANGGTKLVVGNMTLTLQRISEMQHSTCLAAAHVLVFVLLVFCQADLVSVRPTTYVMIADSMGRYGRHAASQTFLQYDMVPLH